MSVFDPAELDRSATSDSIEPPLTDDDIQEVIDQARSLGPSNGRVTFRDGGQVSPDWDFQIENKLWYSSLLFTADVESANYYEREDITDEVTVHLREDVHFQNCGSGSYRIGVCVDAHTGEILKVNVCRTLDPDTQRSVAESTTDEERPEDCICGMLPDNADFSCWSCWKEGIKTPVGGD